MINKHEIKIGNMPVAAVEKLFGYIGNETMLVTFSALANLQGEERRLKIIEILKSLAYFSCRVSSKEGPSNESCFVEAVVLATLESMPPSESILFLEEIASMPKGSLMTNISMEYGRQYWVRDGVMVDFTSTLKMLVGIATIFNWRIDSTSSKYETYIANVTKLLFEGRDTTMEQYVLFAHIKGEAPMVDISKLLAETNWSKGYSGHILLEVLRRLAEQKALSKPGSFLYSFASEVAHKHLSRSSLDEVFSRQS